MIKLRPDKHYKAFIFSTPLCGMTELMLKCQIELDCLIKMSRQKIIKKKKKIVDSKHVSFGAEDSV